MPTYARSLAPNPVPLANLGRLPMYRIKIPPDFLDMLVGSTLGDRYVVLSVIGRGGMSVVYKAKEIKTGKVVAVKTLRTQSLTDEMVVKRFQREAELLSRLNHPRIVNLHAYGTSSRGQPYFVMDFLMGENLVDVLKREDHLEIERFQDIFVQVCAAIEHAHKHGAIHRDIKPGNIMLTRTRATKDYVKVVDFGIAKLAEEAQKLTRMGEVWGSPIYMSPEQCMGAALDARSDIYSLGIVMYECLTGRVPFLGRNYADTMGKQISEPPPVFAKISPNLTIPANLEAIVMTAIEKDPASRYQNLTQMRKDLEVAISAQPSGATSVPPKGSRQQSRSQSLQDFSPAQFSGNKIKAVGGQGRREADASQPKTAVRAKTQTQSKSDLKSQMPSDQDRKHSITKSRMEAAAFDRVRLRNLILIAGGSLILSAAVIALFTHGQSVASLLASLVKQFVGSEDQSSDQQPFSNGQQGQEQAAPGQIEKDPQKVLQDFLTPGGTGLEGAPGEPAPDQNQSQGQSRNDDEARRSEQEKQDQERQAQDQARDEQARDDRAHQEEDRARREQEQER